jgi:trigger factor
MKAEITKRTDTNATLLIEVAEDEIKHAYEHAIAKYKPQVKVAGFRPGKAPDHIVIREIGDATIQSETIEHVVSHAYSDALYQEKLAAIGQPKVDIKKWVPYTTLEFEAAVETVPPVKLADYKKIRKAKKAVAVTETQIDQVLDDLRRRGAERVPALREAKLGDEVKFDFDGTQGGKAVPGASSQGYALKLGSGTFIPGFEDELIGMKVGDEKTFTITFPKDYHEKSLAGEPVDFKVKLQEVSELKLPELNDKFASEAGPFKNVQELRNDIKDQLTVEAEQNTDREYENELLDEVVATSSMQVPEVLVAQQLERLKAEMNQRLAQSGLSLDQYLEAQKQTIADLENEMRPEAERRVKLALVLSQVAKDEKVSVSNEEIEGELDGLRRQYTDPAMQKELAGERIREDIYNHLMASKVITKLKDYAQTK